MFQVSALRIGLLALAGFTLGGCVSLQSVSLTQVPKERSNQVTASADQWSFLGLAVNSDFVNEAVLDLKNQCQGGKLEGVLTKYQSTFYPFVLNREVIATGYCKKD